MSQFEAIDSFKTITHRKNEELVQRSLQLPPTLVNTKIYCGKEWKNCPITSENIGERSNFFSLMRNLVLKAHPYLTPSQYQYWASLIPSLDISTDSEL